MPADTLLPNQTASAPDAVEEPARSPYLYAPAAGTWDEMIAADGSVRPHWQAFAADYFAGVTPAQWEARSREIAKVLEDHGVTYNMYSGDADSGGSARPWVLDSIPFILPEAEWKSVAAGLQQRARLLNAILSDIYGPQKLMRDGWLPPALIFANPGYMRAACGISPPGDSFLVSHGTDLVRGPNGAWMVLADRAQAPSGKGYTLENRNIMAGVLGETFDAANVRGLSGFFDEERDSLRFLAPTRRGNPGVVLMTPGPLNETYFEHAYMARKMGYPLVEGADMTVREQRLFLKTLEGLRRVDVVLRHVDDLFTDPLELNAETWLGVAGITETWRSGNVSLVNGIGTGVVETPALHPFLPGLCQHLLGEELQLPCVPAWWCGQPRELSMVLAEPRRWVVKPAFAYGPRDAVFLDELSSEDLDAFLTRLKAEPHAWAAQEALQLSTAPLWNGSALEPRPLVWRAFSVTAGETCTVMPGGLARVSPVKNRFEVTMQHGGISKDTWIVSDAPSPDAETLAPSGPVILRPLRTPGGVPSRAADNLFWMGRYAERLEFHARLLRTTLQRLSGESSAQKSRERRACQGILTLLDLIPAASPLSALRKETLTLLFMRERTGSVADLVSRLHYNAAAARDRLSDDSWRLFNRLERDTAQTRAMAAGGVGGALNLLDTLMLDLAAFSGMQQENMTRGHGWRFLETGRRVERALSVLALTKAAAALCATDEAVLTPILEVCDSTMTYRRLHFARPALLPVADLILLNEDNPRSVAWQFRCLGQVMAQLPWNTSGTEPHGRELLDLLRSDLGGLNLQALTQQPGAALEVLPSVCDRLTAGIEDLSAQLSRHYFSHSARRGQ